MLTRETAVLAESDFNALRAGDYIDLIQKLKPNGVGDMDAVVLSLDGGVRYAPISGSGMLLDGKIPRIWIRDAAREWSCRQEITKAHEMGHYFLREIADPHVHVSWGMPGDQVGAGGQTVEQVEDFCDYFAHRLIGIPECLANE